MFTKYITFFSTLILFTPLIMSHDSLALSDITIDDYGVMFQKHLETLTCYDKELDLMSEEELEKQENNINDKWDNLLLVCKESFKKYLGSLGDFTMPLQGQDFNIQFCSVDQCRLSNLIPRKMCTRLIISNLQDSGDLLFLTEPTRIFCIHLKNVGFDGPLNYEWKVKKDADSVKEGLELFHFHTNTWKIFLESKNWKI